MKTLTNKEQNYSLHNSENYKKDLDVEINHVVVKLSDLYIEYYKFIIENIKLKKTKLARFIIIRGLDTITNIFNYILFYTKNLDVTYFHCQKAYYFYVEFVGQISEDEKTFLQLSSRDAAIYVYKKTVFDISNEFKKNNEDISDYMRVKLDIINSYIDLYKTLLLKLINDDFTNMEKLKKVENIFNKLNNLSNKSAIKLFNEVIDKLYYNLDDAKIFFDLCMILIKKLAKNPELFKICIEKCISEDFNDKVNEPVEKLANWLTN